MADESRTGWTADLTPRLKQILMLKLLGLEHAGIAYHLGLTMGTEKIYSAAYMRQKTGMSLRMAEIAYWRSRTAEAEGYSHWGGSVWEDSLGIGRTAAIQSTDKEGGERI